MSGRVEPEPCTISPLRQPVSGSRLMMSVAAPARRSLRHTDPARGEGGRFPRGRGSVSSFGRNCRGCRAPGWLHLRKCAAGAAPQAPLGLNAGCITAFITGALELPGSGLRTPCGAWFSHPTPRREQRVMISAWHPEAPFRLARGQEQRRSPGPPSPPPPRPHGLRHAHSAWSYGHCCVRAGGR